MNLISADKAIKSLRIYAIALLCCITTPFIMPLNVVVAQGDSNASSDNLEDEALELTLYVQLGCSHCQNVEEFIAKYDLSFQIDIRDTAVDPGAEVEYTEFLDEMEVPLEERGVPMLKIGSDEWIFGDKPIIEFISNRFSISEDLDHEGTVSGAQSSSSDLFFIVSGSVVLALVIGYGLYSLMTSSRR